MKKPFSIIVASALSVSAFMYSGDSAFARVSKNLNNEIASVLPTPQEDRWLQVPWRTSLMPARVEAQNLNRPMFLWIMNGNPMGCT